MVTSITFRILSPIAERTYACRPIAVKKVFCRNSCASMFPGGKTGPFQRNHDRRGPVFKFCTCLSRGVISLPWDALFLRSQEYRFIKGYQAPTRQVPVWATNISSFFRKYLRQGNRPWNIFWRTIISTHGLVVWNYEIPTHPVWVLKSLHIIFNIFNDPIKPVDQ